MTATTLKPQAMNATTRLASKVITGDRDMTAASGDVSYTGVGFVPTSILAIASVSGAVTANISVGDSAKTASGIYTMGSDNTKNRYAGIVTLVTSGGNQQIATIKSYDADGFTLTWAKTGSPTGTGYITFLCFR